MVGEILLLKLFLSLLEDPDAGFTKKEELMLELEIDGNIKTIEIEDNFMSYIISKKPQTLLNSTNVILRNELLGQVEIDFTQFSKNTWSELYLLTYYFKRINLIL